MLTIVVLSESLSWANAEPSFSPDLPNIQVDHVVEIQNGGLTVIKDTVKLSTKRGESVAPFQSFLLGFPFVYKEHLIYVYAHNTSNQRLDVELDVGLGKPGFYAVKVNFPHSIDVSDGRAYEFTVTFVFSDLITFEISPFMPEPEKVITEFNATFPALPSLARPLSAVNVRITLPNNVDVSRSSFEKRGIKLTNRTLGSFQILSYTEKTVEPFAYEPSWLQFYGMGEDFFIVEAIEIERVIKVEKLKRVSLTDSYKIVSKSGNLSKLTVQILSGAYEIAAWDAFEQPFKEEDLKVERGKANEPVDVTLTFRPFIERNKQERFKLTYLAPWENIINQSGWQHYQLTLPTFNITGWIIRRMIITLILPEGAEFAYFPESSIVQKTAFQEALTFVYYNVTSFHEFAPEIAYGYNVFWFSFRPTLWVGVAVAIIGVLALLWRAPRPSAPIPTILVKPEELKKYVSAYEEKRRSLRLLETLEEKARKGKIPRRRYKVRKRALESRLSVLSKDLTRLREKLRSASSKYANMMRQIEIAEAELEGIEVGIRRTETRYRRGEISTAAYHKLLEDYYRRRERARTTIDGIILRLKEEIT
jgi:hypothetical protein